MDGSSFTFERLRRSDLPLLCRWLSEPHVARWWPHDSSPAGVEADFGPSADGHEPGKDYVVSMDGRPMGFVQLSRFADYPDYAEELADVYPVDDRTATIDYFIGDPTLVGRGLGAAMLSEFTRLVWDQEPDITHLVVPVNSANERSWRALLNAGFHRVARGDMEPDHPADGPAHEILRLDRIEIVRVGSDTTGAPFSSIGPDVFDVDPEPAQLRAFAANPDQMLIVAVERRADAAGGLCVGQCVGHLLPDVVGTRSLYIDNLGVSSAHRRQGVARRLVHDMLAWARERDAAGAWLVADADNDPARAFYRALGARQSVVDMYELDIS
jgi:aminoglycoside 6'-N-acetyltransferase